LFKKGEEEKGGRRGVRAFCARVPEIEKRDEKGIAKNGKCRPESSGKNKENREESAK